MAVCKLRWANDNKRKISGFCLGFRARRNLKFKFLQNIAMFFIISSTSARRSTMPFRFVYRSTDISALSRSLDSAAVYISCRVHKCKWHSSFFICFEELYAVKVVYFSVQPQTSHTSQLSFFSVVFFNFC